MSKFINDFIKDLSIKDKKTLSQKTLKLVEEVTLELRLNENALCVP